MNTQPQIQPGNTYNTRANLLSLIYYKFLIYQCKFLFNAGLSETDDARNLSLFVFLCFHQPDFYFLVYDANTCRVVGEPERK